MPKSDVSAREARILIPASRQRFGYLANRPALFSRKMESCSTFMVAFLICLALLPASIGGVELF